MVRVLTMTADLSARSDPVPLPAQQIFVADPNLLDHRLVLSSFSHDNTIDPKAAKTESVKGEKLEISYVRFC